MANPELQYVPLDHIEAGNVSLNFATHYRYFRQKISQRAGLFMYIDDNAFPSSFKIKLCNIMHA